MKIISKHKDYYDGCNYSHDASTGVYERKQSDIPVDWFGLQASAGGYPAEHSYDAITGIVGFCGKIYPFIRHKYYVNGKSVSGIAYNLEEFEDFRGTVNKFKTTGNYRRWYGFEDLLIGWDKVDKAKLWFNEDFTTLQSNSYTKPHLLKRFVKPKDLFLEHKVPYFVLEAYSSHPMDVVKSKYKLTLNPCLKDYKFYRIFDPYTAWQEIEMFLNNQIVRPDDPYIEPVSDVIKAEAHGFDKYSFRKDKSKKKSKS